MRTAALLIFALACRQAADDTDQVDEDGDGIAAGEDCDDTNASVFPGAEETCNEADDDCDGEVDEDASDAATFYADADDDGHGDPDASVTACAAPEGYVAANDDCDDGNADAHPGGVEVCGGGDEDCDGEVDEDASDATTFYADADGDGHGDADQSLTACEAPEGYVAANDDCDDDDDDAHPGAVEVCGGGDEDCDGEVDEDASDATTFYADADGDGHGDADASLTACEAPEGHVAANDDCDDSSDAIYPGAPEPDCADPVDYNCDGSTGYADGDGDGVAACEDCDDDDASAFPGGTEACGGGDEDCDGQTDEADATGASTWYADADGDGFGAPDTAQTACVQPASTATNDDDCDDALATVHPGADERCNDDDDDCDGQTDEDAIDTSPWYADADDDGYGDPDQRQLACAAPPGHVADATDCDDAEEATWPGAPEACDGADNDCDEAVPADEADNDGNGLRLCDGDCGDAIDPIACEDRLAACQICRGDECEDLGCVEADCGDGVDEDQDTWTDCADPQCWGVGTCERPVFRVTSTGPASLRLSGYRSTTSGAPSDSASSVEEETRIVVEDIVGIATWPSPAPDQPQTCPFTVVSETGRWRTSSESGGSLPPWGRDTETYYPVQRDGAQADGLCVHVLDHLPPAIIPGNSAARATLPWTYDTGAWWEQDPRPDASVWYRYPESADTPPWEEIDCSPFGSIGQQCRYRYDESFAWSSLIAGDPW